MESLERWIARQYLASAAGMLRSISCTVRRTRDGFGQVVNPRQGSIVASPVPGAYDPEPDYFFHWYRDAALVCEALRLLHEHPVPGIDAGRHFADFVHFSRSLAELDGRALAARPEWRDRVAAGFKQYLRTDADLAAVHGAMVAAETRVNPDGSLDRSRWPRPQHDGSALRAITVLRWLEHRCLDADTTAAAEALLLEDLDYVRRRARSASYDIWEEELGIHYYILRVSAAALRGGADWLTARGAADAALGCRLEADAIGHQLDDYWDAERGHYRSRVPPPGVVSLKQLDFSVIFAAIHAGDGAAPHSPDDPRMVATLSRLEELFDAAYAINRARPAERGPAMGRYAGDVYFSGGAYYFSTLGAAEFCFKAARHAANPPSLIERGDAYLRTVRAYTPATGELSEQFDQHTGEQRSARHLAWSYAAFITCIAARRSVVAQGPGCDFGSIS
jgi:glucoamylase